VAGGVNALTLVRPDLKRATTDADLGSVASRRIPGPGVDVAFGDALAGALERAPWACRWLYDRYAGRVFGYLRAQGAGEPEDLTSEVFLRVFDRLRQFSGDEVQFRSWLFTIAYRILVDDARRQQRRPKTIALAPLVESFSAGDVEREALANVGSEWADAMLRSLPPDQRAVLALRVIADLPLDQVAEILDKRVGAVKALQHRALASLRRRCEEVLA
jgi:RNA polymerase sigma-70 factor (ECF subfamily)